MCHCEAGNAMADQQPACNLCSADMKVCALCTEITKIFQTSDERKPLFVPQLLRCVIKDGVLMAKTFAIGGREH